MRAPQMPAQTDGFRRLPAAAGTFCLLTTLCAAPAQASFIDSDFYCRVYGCVVVHDGFTFDVYDVVNLNTLVPVATGQKLHRWDRNPILGTGGVNPVFTGTRVEGFHLAPLTDESFRLGIDTDGDGVLNIEPGGGSAAGFLDAGDLMNPFALTGATDLVAADTSAQRSFYLSSSTDFYLSAKSYLSGPADPLNTSGRLANINFQYQLTRSGNDDGMTFGANARNGNHFRPIGNITHLGQIYAAPQYIMEFRQPISGRNSASLPSQSIRFDYVYGFQSYDLSMGAGRLQYRIEFDFYNR
jgi:hypothetical protein